MINVWKQCRNELLAINKDTSPKDFVERIGNKVLCSFINQPILVDAYDLYERFRNYWDETMQDDCYLIKSGGWHLDVSIGSKKSITYKDIECDLLPVSLIVDVFFPKEKAAETEAREALDSKAAEIQQLRDDNADAFTDDNDKKLTDANIKKMAKQETEYSDIYKLYLKLTEEKKQLVTKASELTAALTQLVVNKYIELNEDKEKVKTTVVDNKWLASLVGSFNEEMANSVLAIINEIKTLANRYADTLPDIEKQEDTLESEVRDSLKQMGYSL